MENIQTLTQLLNNSHCEYQIFDLGRRIKTIDAQVFADVEKGQCPYPFPMQRKAHLAIAYWNEQKQPWIWFLKFELDERGLLKQSDIGNFIKYVVEAMGTRLSEEMSDCDARAFEERIEACVSCRVELEECAAPPEIWSLARQHLEKFRTYRPKSSVTTKLS